MQRAAKMLMEALTLGSSHGGDDENVAAIVALIRCVTNKFWFKIRPESSATGDNCTSRWKAKQSQTGVDHVLSHGAME